ncbi:Serine/threonine-protein kinase 17B [Harpegnathos saltator]|uniref:Serine/threonine-protein kinase 17B n=2 Tax=Harpegnathos saltator TaxID=610380 RepID=E2BMD8_HARSA|nr:Serine/threonine-protein kinase 17B [Harpegnathos saltator]
MEYAPGGDLQTLIDGDLVPLEGDVVHFVRQLVEGLAYLHERNIAHLDIKPQNLVMMSTFPECDVKLCDFEISRVILEGTEIREILGTPDYVAPEILHYEPITLAADMWSLGVTTYVLLTGFSPFGGESDQETFQNISLGEVDFPEEIFEDVSAQAKDFVAKLLLLDPSARMTAKQCLRHDWLRGAPMQASPHLRRYLSKSREVLLERVVSRENLRRAALISQTTSQANLCVDVHDREHQQQNLQDCLLSQSEMCLNQCITESYCSLAGSEDFPSPTNSQTSLNSSKTNLSCTSQSCLLNQEQTQGLLNKAQSRSHTNLNQGLSRGILSRIRSLNRVQSQACLLNGSAATNSIQSSTVNSINLTISKSREKLYGLRCLSKSQDVLDIYRSLECLKRRRKSYQRAQTDDILPIFKQFGVEIASSKLALSINDNDAITCTKLEINSIPDKIKQEINRDQTITVLTSTNDFNGDKQDNLNVESNNLKRKTKSMDLPQTPKKLSSESEENMDSLKSIESDTLTEDSDYTSSSHDREFNVDKRSCERQYSNISSRSNNSATSDDKENRSTESENEEPKYTVAQLVSAFNKHQEVASKTSLKAIMSKKRINELMFPTGTKALRLFIPDINITESKIIRRKTSYKPRKNWEELRKRNEKNEGVLKSFDNDSCNEDDYDDDDVEDEDEIRDKAKDFLVTQANEQNFTKLNIKKSAATISRGLIDWNENTNLSSNQQSLLQSENNNRQFIFIENGSIRSNLDTTIDEKYKQCVRDALMSNNGHDKMETVVDKIQIQPKKMETIEDKIQIQPKLLTQSKIAVTVRQKERLPNYIYANVTSTNKDDDTISKKTIVTTINGRFEPKTSKVEPIKLSSGADTANVNLKDILHRVDSSQSNPKENLENLRKRTSTAKIILNDNTAHDQLDDSDSYKRTHSQAKSEPPAIDNQSDEQVKLVAPLSFIQSSSLSSDNCPTPSSVQSNTNMSWEDIQLITNSSTFLEKDYYNSAKKDDMQRTSSEEKNKQYAEDRKIWGRVCTGSYTRAMERFTGKNIETTKKSSNSNAIQQVEKTRRKSSPAMAQYLNF